MKITCLHTARIHVATSATLFDKAGIARRLDHLVRAELLGRAREGGTAAVADDLDTLIAGMTDADAVRCTCSTLGQLIGAQARNDPRLLQIDSHLIKRAGTAEDTILVAICLPGTRDATLDLLRTTADAVGRKVRPHLLLCAVGWSLSEAGDTDSFVRLIAAQVRKAITADRQIGLVVLAQTSIAQAAHPLAHVRAPVLSSPPLAVDRAMRSPGPEKG